MNSNSNSHVKLSNFPINLTNKSKSNIKSNYKNNNNNNNNNNNINTSNRSNKSLSKNTSTTIINQLN
jgi:hypothetical protein